MSIRILGGAAVLGGLVAGCASGISVVSAVGLQGTDGPNSVLPWAFVLNDPAPDGAQAPDPDEVVSVPGSALSMRRSECDIKFEVRQQLKGI